LDPARFTWQLIVPQQGENEFGVPRQVDALVDTCDSIVSLAHSIGPGGKAQTYGPSRLLVTATGQRWEAHVVDGIEKASFRDLARGDDAWVAVGHGVTTSGTIAVADSIDGSWREVFRNDEFYFNAVAFGAHTFVAVATNGVAFSRDREHWTWASVPSPAQYFDVAFGNGHFVVAGVGAALSSTDGQTWQRMVCRDPSTCVAATPPGPAAPSASLEELIGLQQVSFVGDKFYAFGASGALESSDAKTFAPVRQTIPDAAVGGVLVSTAADAETHWAQPSLNSALTMVFTSRDGGGTWSPQPVTVVESADCTAEPCVVVPAGVLVLRPM
jgi:hypothetical protein